MTVILNFFLPIFHPLFELSGMFISVLFFYIFYVLAQVRYLGFLKSFLFLVAFMVTLVIITVDFDVYVLSVTVMQLFYQYIKFW